MAIGVTINPAQASYFIGTQVSVSVTGLTPLIDITLRIVQGGVYTDVGFGSSDGSGNHTFSGLTFREAGTTAGANRTFDVIEDLSTFHGASASFTLVNPSYAISGAPTLLALGATSGAITVTLTGATFDGAADIIITDRNNAATFTPSVGAPQSGQVDVAPPSGTTFTFTIKANAAVTPLEIDFTNGTFWTDPAGLSITILVPGGSNRLSIGLGIGL